VFYEDPLASIASGLFDGAKLSLNLGQTTLNISGLYSGLQHKERAKIVMTEDDLLDFVDSDTYFASKRLLVSAFLQTRNLGNFNNTLDFGGLAQVDLRNDDGEKLYSQYAALQFGFPVLSIMDIKAGGVFGIEEMDSGSAVSFAANLSAAFAVPGPLVDRLSVSGYISSGSVGEELRPYFPVTAISAGEVFTPSIAGLYTVKLGYQVNPFKSLYVNLTGTYFWRTTRDIIPGTGGTSDLEEDNLGAEVYAQSVWAPLSDLSFNLGGGAFFPAGPVKDAGAQVTWKIKFTTTLSL
jgi:hypothetical protein